MESGPATNGPGRARRRETTAAGILAAAEQTFAESGHRACMGSIASRAGISVGTLYNHFANRDALWAALVRSRREELLVRLDEAMDCARDMPLEPALRTLLGAFVAHWSTHRGFLDVLMQIEPLGVRSPGPRSCDRTIAQELRARVVEMVRRGVEAGVLDPLDADVYPSIVLGALRSLLFFQLEGSPSTAAEAKVERILQVFLNGASKRR